MEDLQFNACMDRIVSGTKSDAKESLHEIYVEYIGYIYTTILQIVQNREDAEDVTSDFFIKLWKNAGSYKSGSGHRAWLGTIARNMAFDLLRKNKKETLYYSENDDVMPEEASPDNVEQEAISDMSLCEALEMLKPAEREIINMKIMGELTFQEIADIMKTPIGTVTWRYQNAIKKLKKCGFDE